MEELRKYLGVNIQNKKEEIEEINEILSKENRGSYHFVHHIYRSFILRGGITGKRKEMKTKKIMNTSSGK